MDHFEGGFENQIAGDIGLQPEVVSADLPLSEQLAEYRRLIETVAHSGGDEVYRGRLVDHYRKMADLVQTEVEKER